MLNLFGAVCRGLVWRSEEAFGKLELADSVQCGGAPVEKAYTWLAGAESDRYASLRSS